MRRRFAARSTIAATVLVLLGVAVTPAWAGSLTAKLSTDKARPGDTVRVTGSSWPGGQLVQVVTCGEGGLTGSVACDNRAALATPVRPDGTFLIDLQVGDPPKACPCVIHIGLVQGVDDSSVNLPLALTGHTTGALPTTTATAHTLVLQEVKLSGGSFLAWFGWPDHLRLRYTVRNPTTATLTGATLSARMAGNGTDDIFYQSAVQNLGPGQSQTFIVPVGIPVFAFGKYAVSVDIGGLAPARASHQAYPWGLFVINALGALLIAWGVLRRMRKRREFAELSAADAVLPAVVRLGGLGAFLVFDDAPMARRLRRHAGGMLSTDGLRTLIGAGDGGPRGGDSVLDLDALGQVLARRYPPGPTLSDTLLEEDAR
jgi:fluoride ion exporter CrcB/FEX